jgi:hypothetical protein
LVDLVAIIRVKKSIRESAPKQTVRRISGNIVSLGQSIPAQQKGHYLGPSVTLTNEIGLDEVECLSSKPTGIVGKSPSRMLLRPLILCLFLLTATTVFAQVPSQPLFWYDASDLTEGQNVNRWVDKSTNGFDAVMPEIGPRPLVMRDSDGTQSVKFLWGQYLQVPSIYPTLSDYTIVAVVRLHDTATISNILSGDQHAFWYDGKLRPGIEHDGRFQQIGLSERSNREGFNIIVATYREETGMVIHHTNGQFGDSLWINSNHDSTLYIGSYGKSYFADCDISELLLYKRVLTESERTVLETELFQKYHLSPPPPLPKPDSTFNELPRNLQLYPRDAEGGSNIPIAGRIYQQGWDSIIVKIFRNGTLNGENVQALRYENSFASFAIAPRIKSELQNYDFEVRLIKPGQDSLIARREKIVSGDVFIIGGASNAVFGPWSWTNQNPFCRTFGFNLSHNPRDTAWAISEADHWGLGPSVSGWGVKLQQLIAEKQGIPTAIINWGLSATRIEHHLKKPGHKNDLRSLYAQLLYRLDKAKLRDAVKAHFNWIGELNDVAGYADELKQLLQDIKQDIPSIKKTYIMQLRPSFCANAGNMGLREIQRLLQDAINGIETMATAALTNYDGCHFSDEGMIDVGERIYRTIARDHYGAIEDTALLRSPTLRKAYYKSDAYQDIILEFEPKNYEMHVGSDAEFEGVKASIRDYFFLDTIWGKIDGVTSVANKVLIHLSEPLIASTISYLPDRYYHGTPIIYEGPWLTNAAGIGAFAFQNVPLGMKLDVGQDGERMLSLFPNPAYGLVHVAGALDSAEPVVIVLFNLQGQELLRERVSPSEAYLNTALDIKLLPAGTYTMQIETSTMLKHLKLVVE